MCNPSVQAALGGGRAVPPQTAARQAHVVPAVVGVLPYAFAYNI